MSILVRYMNSWGKQVYEQVIDKDPTKENLRKEKYLIQSIGPPAGWGIVSAELVPLVLNNTGENEVPLDSLPNWKDTDQWKKSGILFFEFEPEQ
ncbi:MAG: hypothetical protein PHC98_01040 [Syntrophotalea acetylenica]|nr:hypothetical protein [Syntrophotalea acetylenica]